MQLVGATAGYIRMPFLYRSIVQALIGSFFAIAVLLALVYFIQDKMNGIIRLNDYKTLGLLFAIVILLGIVINWISTYSAVTKYLTMKTDKLYN
jgi:cell division transport system permease protein